ncbi:MAG: hypothetical protein RL088_1255 [Verrucomicrobiota bacterium]|jgi:hypothetical protein
MSACRRSAGDKVRKICPSSLMDDYTLYEVYRPDGAVEGPYTLGQLYALWEQARITADCSYRNVVEKTWRPIQILRLHDRSLSHLNECNIMASNSSGVQIGPTTFHVISWELTPTCDRFWAPGLSCWISIQLLALFVDRGFGGLAPGLINPTQVEPPPHTRFQTVNWVFYLRQFAWFAATVIGLLVALWLFLRILN